MDTCLGVSARALIVAPHQDDESIGCGGTIVTLTNAGWHVSVVHVFRGSSAVLGKSGAKAAAIRHKEAVQAATVLGCRLLPNLGFEDRAPLADARLTRRLVRIFRQASPQLVFLPHTNERDAEHRLVARAGREAHWMASAHIWPSEGKPCSAISTLVAYEVWTPNASWSIAVDTTATHNRKLTALRAYRSQLERTSWVKGADGLAHYRATTTFGIGTAEVFELIAGDGSLLVSQPQ